MSMKPLSGSSVLLTGAAGGIGRCLAHELARRGARLVVVDRDAEGLAAVAHPLREAGHVVIELAADLSQLESLPMVVDQAAQALGGLSLLVNNAGLLAFTPAEMESTDELRTLFDVNVLAPMILAREAMPHLRRSGSGRVVNVGSIFGSIAFAHFASYSASKFALRGYSEALRREWADTGVSVTYVAPRATRTGLAKVFGRMAEATGMKLDAPESVAQAVVATIARGGKDRYLGFPESLFVRVNGLLPRLVDKALAKQDRIARSFALSAAKERAVTADPAACAPAHETVPEADVAEAVA